MTTTLYLIVEGVGSYSSRYTIPRWAFRDKARAEALRDALDEIDQATSAGYNFGEHNEPEANARYAALLGERAEEVHGDADWELCEIELIENAAGFP